MRYAIIVVAFLWAHAAAAQQMAMRPGQAGCLTKQWLDDVITFSAAGDNDSLLAYQATGKCRMIEGGLRGTIVDVEASWSTGLVYYQISLAGTKLWVWEKAVITE